ncbi:nucleotidyltransferase domain-containing protein [Lacrimispora sp.]|uniref:nucleotidyltransferase domain-containing protein n=1 Tax=Lacrimispora sp. TaxID=2719234 RepID=UPI0028A90FAD|nr:nucleotidyltransferase domain-containing protein [Lacrimispora sp.]
MRHITKEIEQKLLEIEKAENVKVLHAVESGSRAWGFASPDSDYDVRFIYVRRKEDYLKLNESRDVIEWQLDEVLDINGWDLKKALKQFYRGNATLFEWSKSPIVYKTTDLWKQIYDEAKTYFSVKAAAYHYYGTAISTYSQYLQEESVKYKKYFYALRPLLAGKYIHEYQCPPPVSFDDLMEMDMTAELRNGIDELLEIKKRSDEREKCMQIPIIRDFIIDEIGRQKAYVENISDDRKRDWEKLNDIFLKILG